MDYEILRSYRGSDLADYYRAWRFKRQRRPAPKEATPAYQAAAAGVLVLMGLLFFFYRTDSAVLASVLRWLGAFSLGVGGLLLVGSLSLCPTRSSREKWAAENSGGHYRFSETGFASYIGDAAYACNYAAVEALLEDEGHFYLFMSQNTGHILCKSAFTRGDPESFRTFLEERTGQTFLYVTTR